MVSKASATKGSPQAIDYLLDDKGQAKELDRFGISGENGNEILAEFREIQALNSRCENNTYSIVLSPSNERSFSLEELAELGRMHLKNLGLEGHQYLMTAHLSTDQPHIHLQVNRIDFYGKAHSDQMIGLKAQASAEKIANNLGLKTAKEIQKLKEKETQGIREKLSEINKEAIKKVKTFTEYCSIMASKGVQIQPMIRKNGELQGYNIFDKESGEFFKASKITGAGLKKLIQQGVQIDVKTTEIYTQMQRASIYKQKEILQKTPLKEEITQEKTRRIKFKR